MAKVKGYVVPSGFMGWVEFYKRYILFATEREYYEYIEEDIYENLRQCN